MTETIFIYGKHALTEALTNSPKLIKNIYLSPNVDEKNIYNLIKKNNLSFTALSAGKIPQGADPEAVHQGVFAEIEISGLLKNYKEFIKTLEITNDTSLIILGELEDPHNVGAVIRSAAAFGLAGVLMPEHNQVGVTGTVVKASAGMAFSIPLVSVGNINTIVRDLKEKGFWIYGLDGEAEKSLDEENFEKPTVFILGNESKGIREKTRELCDIMLKIPMHPRCESLNASVSAAISMQAWSEKHPQSLLKF